MPYVHTFHFSKIKSNKTMARKGILYILNPFSCHDWQQWQQQTQENTVSVSSTLPLNMEATHEKWPGCWCELLARPAEGRSWLQCEDFLCQ